MAKLLFIFSAFLLGISSCAYHFSRSTLPSYLKTIVIEPVENKTYQSVLGDQLREEVAAVFKREAPSLRQLNDGGHCELKITLNQYSNKALNFSSGGTVSEYQTILGVEVTFTDIIKDEIIYTNKTLQGIGIYDISKGETEDQHGQKRAIADLQELLVSNILSKW